MFTDVWSENAAVVRIDENSFKSTNNITMALILHRFLFLLRCLNDRLIPAII